MNFPVAASRRFSEGFFVDFLKDPSELMSISALMGPWSITPSINSSIKSSKGEKLESIRREKSGGKKKIVMKVI